MHFPEIYMGKHYSNHVMVVAMVALQWVYAGNGLFAKAAFNQGMSPMIFSVYRQAIATLVLAPASILARQGSASQRTLGIKGFTLVFLAALIGATINQAFYHKGLKLASTTVASAVTNLVPAITFLMAACLGLEKLQMRSIRSMAKICGTIICVGGAVFMALFRGQKLHNIEHQTMTSILHAVGEDWMKGCFFILGSNCCWSLWLILQVPICKSYLDPLSLSTWMCFLSTLQSATLAYYLEPDPEAWKIHSSFEILCCLYAGTMGSAVAFYVQSWCISRRGPLFSAMFNPLCTVITSILACILLHEEVYMGSLVGGLAVVGGLYAVLWGKAEDLEEQRDPNPKDAPTLRTITIDEQHCKDWESQLKEPLLTKRVEGCWQ